MKQVIVWRHDLKVRLGKKMAQAAHAAMISISQRIRQGLDSATGVATLPLSPQEQEWFSGRFTKVVLRVDSEEELLDIHRQATAAGLVSELVVDSGLTEFGGVATPTCCGIGPDDPQRIDTVTGHLKPL